MKQHINGIEVKTTNYKKYARLLEVYCNAVNQHGYRQVHDCYATPIAAKADAESKIWREMKSRNGYGYTVTSYS